MKLTILFYSAICFYFCIPFFKKIKEDSLLNKKSQKIYLALFFVFYGGLWFFCESYFTLLLLSHFPPILFLIGIPYLEQATKQKLISLINSLIVPVKSQMNLGVCFMEAWNQAVETLEETPNKSFILEISEVLKFQKEFWHSSPELRLLINHLIEVRKSPQSLDRLTELQKKMKTETDFKRKSSKALLQLRWQSFVLTGVYFCVFGLSFSSYQFSYPKIMGTSLLFFMLGLYWFSKIGRNIKWSL